MVKEVICDFCKIIRENLDKDIPLFHENKITDFEIVLKNGQLWEMNDGKQKVFSKFEPREAVSICRGFNLCEVHTRTIKKDNKFRLSRGENIPEDLKISKKLTKSDI